MPRKTKVKPLTVKELHERLEWGTRIIKMQQDEIDRLMKLVDKLTDTLKAFSQRS